MSTAEATELTDVLNRVNAWPTTLRITLARKILESLDNAEGTGALPPAKARGLSAAEVQGLLRTDRPPRMTRPSTDGSMSAGRRNMADARLARCERRIGYPSETGTLEGRGRRNLGCEPRGANRCPDISFRTAHPFLRRPQADGPDACRTWQSRTVCDHWKSCPLIARPWKWRLLCRVPTSRTICT